MSVVVRVFPRRTRATPDDALAYVGEPELWTEADEVRISVAFTYDIPRAEQLADEWRRVAPVTIGGPAYNVPSGEFVPGMFLRHGYTITSRGCPNRCWFCSVPKREGGLRELPIRDGWNVLDDNLLACSEPHIRNVFAMLAHQRRRVEFTGGLEAARLEDWHVNLLAGLKPRPVVFFAYDTPNDLEPLATAAEMLRNAGWERHTLRCYVLCGYSGDTMEAAEQRLQIVLALGVDPMAMLWRNERGDCDPAWRTFQRRWARPASIYARRRELAGMKPEPE